MCKLLHIADDFFFLAGSAATATAMATSSATETRTALKAPWRTSRPPHSARLVRPGCDRAFLNGDGPERRASPLTQAAGLETDPLFPAHPPRSHQCQGLFCTGREALERAPVSLDGVLTKPLVVPCQIFGF